MYPAIIPDTLFYLAHFKLTLSILALTWTFPIELTLPSDLTYITMTWPWPHWQTLAVPTWPFPHWLTLTAEGTAWDHSFLHQDIQGSVGHLLLTVWWCLFTCPSNHSLPDRGGYLTIPHLTDPPIKSQEYIDLFMNKIVFQIFSLFFS